MPVLNLESLLAPVSDAEPAGPNLEYDRDFATLERMSQGKPERQMGDQVLAAEDPDWKALGQGAVALLGRSKDLRAAIHLTRSALRTSGLAGFSEGVHLVRELLERYWDGVHPRLDADDDNDPTMRMNTLASLADSATLSALRSAPLVTARGLGSVSLRDFLVATGEVPAVPGQATPDMTTIEATFDGVDFDALMATTNAVSAAREDVLAIEALLGDKVGAAQSANLSRLSGTLEQARKHLASRVERRSPVIEPDDTAEIQMAQSDGDGQASSGAGRGTGPIRSRDDVVKALDVIAAYYQKFEPSSPVPLLLARAKKLARMSFVDIMKNMAPDAMSQIDLISGPSETDEGSSSS
jgi:type VI secretion system protein ImpA